MTGSVPDTEQSRGIVIHILSEIGNAYAERQNEGVEIQSYNVEVNGAYILAGQKIC